MHSARWIVTSMRSYRRVSARPAGSRPSRSPLRPCDRPARVGRIFSGACSRSTPSAAPTAEAGASSSPCSPTELSCARSSSTSGFRPAHPASLRPERRPSRSWPGRRRPAFPFTDTRSKSAAREVRRPPEARAPPTPLFPTERASESPADNQVASHRRPAGTPGMGSEGGRLWRHALGTTFSAVRGGISERKGRSRWRIRSRLRRIR